MPRVHLVSTQHRAQKATSQLLFSNGILGVCCKSGRYGSVSLVTVSTWEGQVYVFDVKSDREVIFDGGVSRVLQSPDVMKVMHDCSAATANLQQQHGIHLRNVFDTQIAYSVILESEGLPARRVDLQSLCQKTSIPQYTPSDSLKKLLREDKDVWMRRPLTSDMLNTLASEVEPLVPHLYTKLLKAIRPEHMSWFERMNDEQRSSLCKPVTVRRARKDRLEQEKQETSKCRPLQSLTSRQRVLLADTTPLSREIF